MRYKPYDKDMEKSMREIVRIAKRTFKDSLLLVGAKGSIARGDFGPYSDFDLVIIVEDKKLEQWPEFMYNNTYFDIQVISFDSVVRKLLDVSMSWPAEAGGKLGLRIFYDKANTYDKLYAQYNKVKSDKKKFENAISLNTLTEYYSKAIRYFQNKDFDSLRWACLSLFEEFSMILALLNRKYYVSQGPKAKIEQISKFDYLPMGWKNISEKLISKNGKDNIEGANLLWSLCDELAARHEFKNHSINDISDIKFKK